MPNARHGLPLTLLALAAIILGCTSAKGAGNKNTDTQNQPHHLQVNSDGLVERGAGKERVLVSVGDGAYVNGVAVSSDNKRLAFVLQPPASVNAKGEVDFGTDLYISDRDGKNRQEVLHHGANGEFIYAPFFLPDNQSLIYVVRGRDELGLPDFRLESMDLRTGTRTRLIEHAVDVGLAPDGKTVAYVYYNPNSTDGEQLLLTDLGSKAQPKVLVPAERGLVLLGSPVFSPDGSQIAFAASTGVARLAPAGSPRAASATLHPTLQDLFLVNRDGSDLHLVAEIVESQPSIDWSSDGSLIYVLGGGAFWKVDPKTGDRSRIGEGAPGGLIRMLKDS